MAGGLHDQMIVIMEYFVIIVFFLIPPILEVKTMVYHSEISTMLSGRVFMF